MRGYVVHHQTCLYDGVRADRYRNDPYAWARPYLWSFCHLNQNPRVEQGMTVLFVSRVGDEYHCDMVFEVAACLPFREAYRRFAATNRMRRVAHFKEGIRNHPEVKRGRAMSYVATNDLTTSYIPHPSVRIDHMIDANRLVHNKHAKPLREVLRRPSVPLRIVDIAPIAAYVRANSTPLALAPWADPECEGNARWRRPKWTQGWRRALPR